MKFTIDNTRCKNPDTCMKCIQICPAKVFVLKPILEKKTSYVMTFKINALFKDTCNGCMKCVEICPEKCIHIEF